MLRRNQGQPLDAEAQWRSRMDELYAREAALSQAGMLVSGAAQVENIGLLLREVQYNIPEKSPKNIRGPAISRASPWYGPSFFP